ncbi:mitogen-activated protein kinase kinase kinase 19-like [Physella acuta]|uniref:mitogen-activated protein kinase kinase kinase 19-like n=1 Tax=Physella acuta TaxID=109671 RepID=UPI0027DD6D4A|nr:mitogen-activated protein kinase kinase kinase 19-like [Physella acuta]
MYETWRDTWQVKENEVDFQPTFFNQSPFSDFPLRYIENLRDLRSIKEKLKSVILSYFEQPNEEQIKTQIQSVMSKFVRTREFHLFEFFVYQKYFEIVYKCMKCKSQKERSMVGDQLADLKYAELTTRPMRENKLLFCPAPHFIKTVLKTLRLFSNASESFAKSLAEQGIVDVLTERLRDMKVDVTNNIFVAFLKYSVGILINIFNTVSKENEPEIHIDLSQYMETCDIKLLLAIKLLNVCVKETSMELFPNRGEIQILVNWIKSGMQCVSRAFNGFNISSMIQCLTKICLKSKLIFEILDSEPLDCLYNALCSDDKREQKAAGSCLLAIAQTSQGRFKIKEHREIIIQLEFLQNITERELEKIITSILWLTKREAITFRHKQEVLAPGFPVKWQKSSFLGRGQFGCVYLLKDKQYYNNEKYIIKEIEFEEESHSKEETEWSILLKTEHYRLVKFYGFIKNNKTTLLFFEYMCQGSLRKYTKENGGILETEVKIFTRQILEGLNYLHTHSPPIIHRDIKGDNVLLDKDHQVKIADFGLARIITESSKPKTGLGTAKWMAPEILKGNKKTPYDCKADIWSLGCTVVEMATTSPPFPDHNKEQHMYQLALGKKPEYILPEASTQEMQTFLDRIFIYDPLLRPSALELLSDPFVAFRFDEQ